jgi:hypothetical protein
LKVKLFESSESLADKKAASDYKFNNFFNQELPQKGNFFLDPHLANRTAALMKLKVWLGSSSGQA